MKTYPCDRCNMDEGSPVCLQDERCQSDGAERSVEARVQRSRRIDGIMKLVDEFAVAHAHATKHLDNPHAARYRNATRDEIERCLREFLA